MFYFKTAFRVVRQAGLDELVGITKEEVATNFMPAAVTGLADGDIAVLHPPYRKKEAELYGANQYGDGRVAKAIAKAAIENGRAPTPMYDFQIYAAEYFAKHPLFTHYKTMSSVQIYPETITIDGNPLMLPNAPRLVLDYGACLTGRSYIDNQMNFLDRGVRPFAYGPLTRLPFMNQTLIAAYDTTYGVGTARVFVDKGLYIGREDGVAAATDEIIRAQRAHNAPTEVADIILCTGSQHTPKTDLQHAVTNAYRLLREDGMLLVRSLARPASDEIGTDAITDWAFNAGFEERHAIRYQADLNQVGTLLLTGHFGEREIQTAVLKK